MKKGMTEGDDAMTDGPTTSAAVGDPNLASVKEDNARILADYALWKRNTPLLYDMLMVCRCLCLFSPPLSLLFSVFCFAVRSYCSA